MLSDRGFFDTAWYYPNMNHQKTPKFLSGRDQFTEGEVSADRRICKLRYTCEVAFSRVTKTKGLRDVILNDNENKLILRFAGHHSPLAFARALRISLAPPMITREQRERSATMSPLLSVWGQPNILPSGGVLPLKIRENSPPE